MIMDGSNAQHVTNTHQKDFDSFCIIFPQC